MGRDGTEDGCDEQAVAEDERGDLAEAGVVVWSAESAEVDGEEDEVERGGAAEVQGDPGQGAVELDAVRGGQEGRS